jgi:hypothetical protein
MVDDRIRVCGAPTIAHPRPLAALIGRASSGEPDGFCGFQRRRALEARWRAWLRTLWKVGPSVTYETEKKACEGQLMPPEVRRAAELVLPTVRQRRMRVLGLA